MQHQLLLLACKLSVKNQALKSLSVEIWQPGHYANRYLWEGSKTEANKGHTERMQKAGRILSVLFNRLVR